MNLEEKMKNDSNIFGTLEIYHISISLGDATVLVTRDKDDKIINTVLIDLGTNADEVFDWCTNSEEIKGFKEDKNLTFDYIIISHNHADHIDGIRENHIIGREIIYSYVSDGTLFKGKRRKHNGSVDNITSKPKLKKEDKNQKNLIEYLKINNDKDSLYTIKLAKNIALKCICANGIYISTEGKMETCPGNFKSCNDHSITWLLEYENDKGNVVFRYFTAGDLSGSNDSNYTNIEEKVTEYLKHKKITVDLLKATHHGSKFSMQNLFLTTIEPKEIVVPCNNSHLLPFPQFFQRIHHTKKVVNRKREIEAKNNGNQKAEPYEPKIYITNYMFFKFSDYKKKFLGNVDEGMLKSEFEKTTPKIIFSDDQQYVGATKEKKEDTKTKMIIVKTTIINNKVETTHKNEIECTIKVPTNSQRHLFPIICNLYYLKDNLYYNYAAKITYKAYKEKKKQIDEIKADYFKTRKADILKKNPYYFNNMDNEEEIGAILLEDFYDLNEEKNMYTEKEEIEESLELMKNELANGYRAAFKDTDYNLVSDFYKSILVPSFAMNFFCSEYERVYEVRYTSSRNSFIKRLEKLYSEFSGIDFYYKDVFDRFVNLKNYNQLAIPHKRRKLKK